MKNHNMSLLALMLSGMLALTGCGDDGHDGADGADGSNGADGQDGQNAGDVVSTVYKAGDVTFTIDPAENTLAGGDALALKFSVAGKNQAGAATPLTGLEMIAVYSITAVTNTTSDGPSVYWENNGDAAGAHSMYCTLDGTYTSRGQTGEACTLVEDPANPGTYTGTWEHEGTAPIMNADDDLNAPHRVMIRVYNVTDANGKSISDKILGSIDYIPATGETGVTTGKDTVADAACKQCHGESEATGNIANISAHSNYQSVENCVFCHNPATQPDEEQAAEGYVFDLPAMIHRIHGGAHLAELAPYGFIQTAEWAEIGYPAPLDQCTVCHSQDEGKTTWKDEPTRAACGGCHTNIDFATGENHADFELAQADDSQCASCHGTGGLAPEAAHAVGARAVAAENLTVDFTSAQVSAGVLTITANVTLNKQPITDIAQLNILSGTGILLGGVDSTGQITRWGARPSLSSASGSVTNATTGEVTLTVAATASNGIAYVGTEANFCAQKDGTPVACSSANAHFDSSDPVGVTSKVKFFDLATGTEVTAANRIARMADPARITIAEAKCNACHTSLDYIKGSRHGVYTFDQCMDCHNNTYQGSYHPFTNLLTTVTNADETETTTVSDSGSRFYNRDLATVAHRFHSGNMNDGTEPEGIFLDGNKSLHGYPAPQANCAVCHTSDALFKDGALTSGRTSIAISITAAQKTTAADLADTTNFETNAIAGTTYYISPVAEACRACHTSSAAVAHFKSNGAVVADDLHTVNDLTVESCATCHAAGRANGIDKVHDWTAPAAE